MLASRLFFIALSALISLTGLFAAAWAHDYLHGFGLALAGFGALFALSCVKRHHDEKHALH